MIYRRFKTSSSVDSWNLRSVTVSQQEQVSAYLLLQSDPGVGLIYRKYAYPQEAPRLFTVINDYLLQAIYDNQYKVENRGHFRPRDSPAVRMKNHAHPTAEVPNWNLAKDESLRCGGAVNPVPGVAMFLAYSPQYVLAVLPSSSSGNWLQELIELGLKLQNLRFNPYKTSKLFLKITSNAIMA